MSTPRAVVAAPAEKPLEEVRHLYRSATEAEGGSDRARYLTLLKAFLAGTEGHPKEVAGAGEEFGPWLDDAAMAFYRNGQPSLARRAIDRGLECQPGAAALLHHKALILLAQNQDLPDVVALTDQALQATPHDRGLWATRGDALKLLNRPEEAAAAYLHAQELDTTSTQYVDRALKLTPQDPVALRKRVEMAQALGGDVAALEACDELLKSSPSDPGLRLSRARLLAAVGREAEAREVLAPLGTEHPELDGAAVLAIRLDVGRVAPAALTAEVTALLEREPAPDGTTLAEVAQLLEPGAPELGLAVRQKLRTLDPRNLQNLLDLRRLAVRLGQIDVALLAAQAVLEIQPDNLQAMMGVAETLTAQGDMPRALEAYRVLLKAHPQAVSEWHKALDLARKLGNEAAVRDFSRGLLSEDASDPRAQLELARSLATGGEVAEALKAYDALIASHPGELSYLLEKKDLLAQSEDVAQLAPLLDELFHLDPTRTDVAVERGNLYLRLAYDAPEGSSEREKAARTALTSYERASSEPTARAVADLGLARASRLVGESERAIRGYEAFLAEEENKGRRDVRRELGHALRENGRYSEALEVYAGTIADGADDPDLLWGAVEVMDHLNQETRALQLLDLLLRREPNNPIYLRKEGQLLLRIGRRADALRILQRAVQSADGDPHSYFEVAEALRAQGTYADAIDYYRKGLALDPKNRHGRLALAETLQHAGQFTEVIQLVDPLLTEEPNDVAAWKARADAWRALGRPAEVLYSLRAILLLEPDDPSSLLEKFRLQRDGGETKEAYGDLSRLLSSDGPESKDPALHLERGDMAAALGRTEEASQSYEKAAELDPALRAEIAQRRARLRLNAGRPDLALEVLEDGQRALPSGTAPSVGALLLRADILLALERPSEARTVYEDVLKRDGKSPVALAGLARTMLDEGQPGDAAKFLADAISQVPPQEALFLLLAEAESGSGHLEKAAAAVDAGVAALPKSVALWTRSGEVATARQDWPAAATSYHHALALAPNQVEVLLRAGFVAERQSHPNEALALYERGAEVDPSNKQAWTSRGLALLAIGRPTDAAASFERALALDSDFAPAKDGKKLASEKTRDQQVGRFGREALLLEARLNRPVTKNDLFVTIHVPYEYLESVLAALGRPMKVDLDHLSSSEVHDLENASYHLVTAALERRPPGIERRGFTLADVAVLSPPTASLEQIQRSFGYLQAVLESDLRAENLRLTPDVEELARKALVLPPEQRTLFQLVRTLRVGIYKARLIKAVEEAGAAQRAPLPTLDLGAYSPEFRGPGAPEGTAPPAPEEFFAPENTPRPSPGAETPATEVGAEYLPPSAAAPTHAPAPGARCIGCGGIASVGHACGAPLCQHCIGQFPTCPKCGQTISTSTVAPLGGVTVHAAASHKTGTKSGSLGALKGVFQRSKPAVAKSTAPAEAPKPAHAPAEKPKAPPPAAAKKAPPPPKETKAVEPPAPPTTQPPPPRPKREKPDDEPRL